MNQDVTKALADLQRAFPQASLDATDDGAGGAHFFLRNVDLGERYVPRHTWLASHIPALYPYADLYPVFTDPALRRVDGVAFVAPVTHGATFAGEPAIQISRRYQRAQHQPQTALAKLLKIIDFLRTLP